MADIEPPLLRVPLQQQHSSGTITNRPNASNARQTTSPRLSAPATPDQERGTDPLSAHIIARTHTGDAAGDSPTVRRGLSEMVLDKAREYVNPEPNASSLDVDRKDRKKRVSFFAKLRGQLAEDDENIDATDELDRAEGTDASTFCTTQQTAVPTYIRVRSSNKAKREFNNLFLAQELFNETADPSAATPVANEAHAVWSMKFSHDGRFLATGGQDMVVRVWRVLSSPKDRCRDQHGEAAIDSTLNAAVFCAKPFRVYSGHTADVLDLSWSRNNFLLSSSMDKTVRLWHVSREECLCCFQHSDFVTSIAFHPHDDKYFISGSLDCKLRLWNISDKKVSTWNELPELITAVAFSSTGRMVIAGTFTGLCLFYETDGLRYHTQIHVRSTRGRNAHGSKITGIQAVAVSPGNPHSDTKLLITSNDSRIRMYNQRDKSLEMKFKGNENKYSQIRASFSDGLHYVICGSEDRQVYIWDGKPIAGTKDKKPFEHFESHSNIVTATAFAPFRARENLASSGDPIYDIVNAHNPRGTTTSHSTSSHDTSHEAATHNPHDGNIIICADYNGRIKIFRQDSAMHLRNKTIDRSDSASIRSGTPVKLQRAQQTATATEPAAKRSPSVTSQTSSIVRKPHEFVVPTSPARNRTGTTLSTDTGSTGPTNSVTNGSPKASRKVVSKAKSAPGFLAPDDTNDPSKVHHQHQYHHELHSQHHHHESHNHHVSHDQSSSSVRSKSRTRDLEHGSDHAHDNHHTQPKHKSPLSFLYDHNHDEDHHKHPHHHHHHKQHSRTGSDQTVDAKTRRAHQAATNPFIGPGGESLGFYDLDSLGMSGARPSVDRQASTMSEFNDKSIASTMTTTTTSAIRCRTCGGHSFAVAQAQTGNGNGSEMRLTCMTCHSIHH